MTVGVAFVSDRADLYLPGCLESFSESVPAAGLSAHVVDDRDHRLGMAGAVREAWEWALDEGVDHLLHLEEDFRFTAPVEIDAMVYVLERAPHLAQVVLKRQPWSPEEQAAGGIVECHPDDYVECGGWGRHTRWTEHRRIFSLNPCLIPRHVLELGWPDGNEAEFTRVCLDKGLSFAFYGAKFDPPRVVHVGAERGAGWRL